MSWLPYARQRHIVRWQAQGPPHGTHVARRTSHVARRTSHVAPTLNPARWTLNVSESPVVLLISTYDLGRQPFGLASAAASLRAAGVRRRLRGSREGTPARTIRCAQRSRRVLPADAHRDAAGAAGDRARARAESRGAALRLSVCTRRSTRRSFAAAASSDRHRRGVRGRPGRSSADARARTDGDQQRSRGLASGRAPRGSRAARARRVSVPFRDALPPLSRYATLQVGDERRIVGYTEASRGCKHRCRHCPIVPVYDGRFRIVPVDVVLADVARAGGRRRAARDVRRSRFLQRHPARRRRSSSASRASAPA